MHQQVCSLPVSDWPAADRERWDKACRPAQRLKAGGAASGMQPVSQLSHARMYGYLLDFCNRGEMLDPDAEPAGHVTPQMIDAFLGELHDRVGSVTRATYIERVRRVAEILAPDRDFGWLREIERDLRYEARPRPKHHRIVASNRLRGLGLGLIERGETSTGHTDLRRARLVRDGLMIALLALCPIRLKNFAAMQLGQQIKKVNGVWWIVLDATETKSGRPDERPIDEILHPHIERWLMRWRPLFLDPSDAFWSSTKGGSLSYKYISMRLAETTHRELGISVSPHLFRDCAVYTVATEAGDEMGVASGLLQHTDLRVTEKHYNKGASINATRKYQQIMQEFSETA